MAKRTGDKSPPRTVKGYDTWEVVSALQKEIRRGNIETAMWWALELAESEMPIPAYLWARLIVIAHEDIGTGDPSAAMFAIESATRGGEWMRKGKGSWKLALSNAIITLCEARHCRDADHLQAAMRYRRMTGPKAEIPDYALDKHTRRGKAMNRGVNHFVHEATKLADGLKESPKDWVEDARNMWHEAEKRERGLF